LLYAIDEILRIHGPLVGNRRVTKCPVEIGGRKIGAGQRVAINWISANRDETVFADPEKFRFGRDESKNLLYGAGVHVCPGAPLASLEMRIFTDELLSRAAVRLGREMPAQALYPSSGFSKLRLNLHLT